MKSELLLLVSHFKQKGYSFNSLLHEALLPKLFGLSISSEFEKFNEFQYCLDEQCTTHITPEILVDVYFLYLSNNEIVTGGIYYTQPKEIDLICEETLKRFTTKNPEIAIDDITVIDPACGCGNFLIGILNKLFGLLETRYAFFKGGEISDYLECIVNNIYGLELDARSAEIARLRIQCWYLNKMQQLGKYESLGDPPISYGSLDLIPIHVYTGNALIQLLGDTNVATLCHTVEIPQGTFIEYLSEQKKALSRLSPELWNNQATIAWLNYFEFQGDYDPLKYNIYRFFQVFKRGRGFDLVIGNPPYVQLEKLPETKYYNDALAILSSRFPAVTLLKNVTNRRDLYIDFCIFGLSILDKNGVFGFLISDSWLDTKYGAILQELLLKYTQFDIWNNSNTKSFEAEINTTIIFAELQNENCLATFVNYSINETFEYVSTISIPNTRLLNDRPLQID